MAGSYPYINIAPIKEERNAEDSITTGICIYLNHFLDVCRDFFLKLFPVSEIQAKIVFLMCVIIIVKLIYNLCHVFSTCTLFFFLS